MTTSPLLHTAVPPRLILLTLIRRSRGHAIAWPVGKADGRREATPGDDRRDGQSNTGRKQAR